MPQWFVYLLLCRDGSLYCGIAVNVARRVAQHNAGAGAKYMVPSRRPAACVWKRRARDRGDALRLEHWLKQRDAVCKRNLAAGLSGLRRMKEEGWRVVPKAHAGSGKPTRKK